MAICRKSALVVLAGLLLLSVASSLVIAADAAPGIQVHGYLLNRGYVGPGSTPEYRLERVSVSANAVLPEDQSIYTELYYHPWAPNNGLYLESGYYDKLIDTSHLRVGKGRRMTFGITPAYPNRKTSNYGIVSEAFTQDRIQGVQYFGQKGAFEYGATVQQGMRLGTRAVGDISGDTLRALAHTVPHLALRDANSGGGSPTRLNSKLEFAGRVGGVWQNGLRAGVSLDLASLDPDDLTALTTSSATNTLTPSTPGGVAGATPALLPAGTSDKDRNVLGLDFMWKSKKSPFVLQGEFYDASVSTLDYNAWDVLAGIEPITGWRFYARYSKQNMDITPTANPLSWDISQVTLSAVQPLKKALWLQYEYEFNREDTPAGISHVKNDLFFVELFSGF